MRFSTLFKYVLPLFLSGLLLWSCASSNSSRAKAAIAARDEAAFGYLESNLPIINLDRPPAYSHLVEAYFDYYDLNFENTTHHFGRINSNGYTIAVHVYRPRNPAGSAFVLHGYNDHSALMRRLIGAMLELDLAVITYDLPGHGLSSGERSTIPDFQQYLDVFSDVKQRFERYLQQPHYLMGHSTGGAISFDYLLHHPNHTFEKLILLAPLVRSSRWRLSKTGHFIMKPFKKTVGRRFHPETSDSAYVQFWLSDPLQNADIPLEWIQAMFNWEKHVAADPRDSLQALIIQGRDDGVVDWEHNIPVLRAKFPNNQMLWLQTARHQLVNEGGAIRDSIYQAITSFLQEAPQ